MIYQEWRWKATEAAVTATTPLSLSPLIVEDDRSEVKVEIFLGVAKNVIYECLGKIAREMDDES